MINDLTNCYKGERRSSLLLLLITRSKKVSIAIKKILI